MIFLKKKKYTEIYFLQMLWKCDISRKIAPEYDLFCIIWKKDVPCFPKYGIFFL